MIPSAHGPEPHQQWILIGKLGTVHGLRGELRLFTLSDVPGRWESLKEAWWLGPKKPERLLRIKSLRAAAGFYLAQFEGFEDRDAALTLCRGMLALPQEQRGRPPAGSFFIDEVLGMEVEDQTGRVIGRVTEIYQTGANDIYAIAGPDGEILLPALKTVILRIDAEARRMQVRNPLDYRV